MAVGPASDWGTEDRINVAAARIQAGMSSLSTETTLLGRDYAAEERRMSQDLGVSIDQLRALGGQSCSALLTWLPRQLPTRPHALHKRTLRHWRR